MLRVASSWRRERTVSKDRLTLTIRNGILSSETKRKRIRLRRKKNPIEKWVQGTKRQLP